MKILIIKNTTHILKSVFKERCSPFAVQNEVHLSRLNANKRERPIYL